MTIIWPVEVEQCTFCNGIQFNVIPSRPTKYNNGGYRLIECSNKSCKGIKDITVRGEDVKHAIYHETGKQPEYKMDLNGK